MTIGRAVALDNIQSPAQILARLKSQVQAQSDQSFYHHGVIPEGGYPDGNPKTAAGAKKPDLTVIPPTSLLHLATAMMNGEAKYGLYNWRESPISSRPYIAAALRHLLAYLDGEDFSQDTVEAGKPVHHLAHVMATCAIVLDAMEVGVLNDNRGAPGKAGDMVEHYNKNGVFA